MILIGNIAKHGSNSNTGSFLLDIYIGAEQAVADFKLKSGIIWGSRIRRGADNEECDVGWDSNNRLSLNSTVSNFSVSSNASNLGEFLASTGYTDVDLLGVASDAFRRTFYDQSGNDNHWQQATAGKQPKIATAGVLETKNGRPCDVFDGSDDEYDFTPLTLGSGPWTVFTVQHKPTPGVVGACVGATGATVLELGGPAINFSDNKLYIRDGNGFAGSALALTSPTDQKLYTTLSVGGNATIRANSSDLSASTFSNDGTGAWDNVGNYSGNFDVGGVQCSIIYSSDQSSNLSAVETILNTEYSIY